MIDGQLHTFVCKCGYVFPDITVTFNHDEIQAVMFTVVCPQCKTTWEQKSQGGFAS